MGWVVEMKQTSKRSKNRTSEGIGTKAKTHCRQVTGEVCDDERVPNRVQHALKENEK